MLVVLKTGERFSVEYRSLAKVKEHYPLTFNTSASRSLAILTEMVQLKAVK